MRNNPPFTIVDEPAFKSLFQSVRPEFQLLNSKSLKTRILQSYVTKKHEVQRYFNEKCNSKLSATTDLWTSANHISMMVVTVTWVDEEFIMSTIIVGFRQLENEHSGTNICRLFMEILKEFQIEQKVK